MLNKLDLQPLSLFLHKVFLAESFASEDDDLPFSQTFKHKIDFILTFIHFTLVEGQ